MDVARDLAPRDARDRVPERVPDGVEEHGWAVACHGFRGEQRAADRLAHHGQDRVPLWDHQGSPFELDDAGWGWQ